MIYQPRAISRGQQQSLMHFAPKPLEEPYLYMIPDTRYDKVREDGLVISHPVPSVIGIIASGAGA